MGAHDFKLNKVPLFRSKTCEYQCFEACFSKTSSYASKPLFLRCKVVILMSVPSFDKIERDSDGGS